MQKDVWTHNAMPQTTRKSEIMAFFVRKIPSLPHQYSFFRVSISDSFGSKQHWFFKTMDVNARDIHFLPVFRLIFKPCIWFVFKGCPIHLRIGQHLTSSPANVFTFEGGDELTLKQTCHRESPMAPLAFKDLMIHWILQFTLRIAVCCVLHRCTSQEIHR